MSNSETLKIIGRQPMPFEADEMLKAIYESENKVVWAIFKAYLYGVMRGKQQERARRKGGATL